MSAAKRRCTNKDRDDRDGRAEDCDILNNNDTTQALSIHRMPLEILEKILMDTVVAQVLHASTTTCAIKKCSRYDDNLILACRLWQQIVDGRPFKEIVRTRVARIDPKAVYKRKADPVNITGIDMTNAVEACTMNDNAYTIEYERNEPLIFIYDIDFIKPNSTNNQKSFFELRCTNRRPLPPVAAAVSGLNDAFSVSFFVPSPKENCLFLQPWSDVDIDGRRTLEPQVFKLAHDGTVSAHWHLDQDLSARRLAVDPLGQHLVFWSSHFAHVVTSVGLPIATIAFNADIAPNVYGQIEPNVRILSDSTLIINFGNFTWVHHSEPGVMPTIALTTKLVNLKPTRTSGGLLQYEDLDNVLRSGRFVVRLDIGGINCDHHDRDSFFVDREGCHVTLLENKLIVVDEKERKTVLTAKHPSFRDSWNISRFGFQFDESRGLLFFRQHSYSRRWPLDEVCALHLRY